MKWLLVMLISGSPIKTDLYFPTLGECLAFEDQVAAQYANAYNEAVKWARENRSQTEFAGIEKLARERMSRGTCMPASK